MIARIGFAALLLGFAASPALAVPFCTSYYGGASFQLGIGDSSFGRDTAEQDRISADTMRLRRAGVDVESLDYWNGCIRAWVRQANGRVSEEFYDPASLRRVE
jgi:hypothetical protein